MAGSPDVRAYARGIAEALDALTELFDQPLDQAGVHPLADLTTWEIRDLARRAVVERCRISPGYVPPAVARFARPNL
jgi:hypothetical protein